MKLREIEKRLGIKFPARHEKAMADAADPVHEACDFLLPTSPHEGLLLLKVNEFLHGPINLDRGRVSWWLSRRMVVATILPTTLEQSQ